jgi:glycosyltransferase involved in cell wall biosynthesis
MQIYLRTRKDLSIAWRSIIKLPRHIFYDTKGFLRYLVSELFHFIPFHKNAKSIAIKFGIIQVHAEENLDQVSISSDSSQATVQKSKPIILASYCRDINFQGNLRFCGGTKELNYLLKLVRQHGYEAYMVTYDGTYEPWLLDHQPHISLDDFHQILQKGCEVRCVTSWAMATAFIQASPHLYFWDMELAHTEHEHFPILANLYRRKIFNTASISRTIQAWHMAHFQRSCVLLPNLLDESLWSPQPELRKAFRIGYMNEGKHTDNYIELIRNITHEQGLTLEFHQIRGVETEILDQMCSCDVYLSMNIGKDALWGEGCPRTVLEALSTGCVVIAFDIIGNHETLQHNFNGIIVPRYRPDLMAESLIEIYSFPKELSRLRDNALNLINSCHTLNAHWPDVKEFLDL